MEDFIINRDPEKPDIPGIALDSDKGYALIEGGSFMEEPRVFYAPVLNWFNEYTQSNANSLIFDLKLHYFNTSTSKMLSEIFKVLIKYQDNGGSLEVSWYYELDDDDLSDEIDNYQQISGIEINKIPLHA
jgi:hypothetical protein